MSTAVAVGPGLGRNEAEPIRVGGGFLFGAFNERQYLFRLRGPDGHAPAFTRRGSFAPDGARGPLDVYELSEGGLSAPVHLLMCIYTRAPLAAPDGFTLDHPEQLTDLPIGLTGDPVGFGAGGPASAGAPVGAVRPAATVEAPRRWRVLAEGGETMGFAAWDGATADVKLDMTPNVQQLMRRHLDHFMPLTPAAERGAILADYFERFLPLESGGVARGVAESSRAPAPWAGPIWGETPQAPRKAKKWYWPW